MPSRSVIELEFEDQKTEICVDPEVALADARLKRLHQWWLGAPSRGFPAWSDPLLDELDFIGDALHLHEAFDGGAKFQVRHVAPGLTRLLGLDATGMWFSSERGQLKDLAPSLFRAFEIVTLAFQMKAPLRTFSKSSHAMAGGRFKGESLWLPLSNSGAAVDFILCATVLTPLNGDPEPAAKVRETSPC